MFRDRYFRTFIFDLALVAAIVGVVVLSYGILIAMSVGAKLFFLSIPYVATGIALVAIAVFLFERTIRERRRLEAQFEVAAH